MSEPFIGEVEKRQSIINKAVVIALDYGAVDGAHHKMWVIDQILRALTGCPEGGESDKYRKLILDYNGEDYEWDRGIAP